MEFKTLSANKNTVQKEWLLVDASDQILGRLASIVAKIIRGKYKSNYTPHVDCGDNVVIINADKIRFSGEKLNQKEYIRHTGYPGGQRSVKAKDLLEKDPARIIKMAVKGMLPKNKLGSSLNKNLHVYVGADHKNGGQKPKKIDLKDY
tara:strand:+ start:1986 stop:2429 length:444 start_codon:yes stop_codon:yes gene_type:complete